MASFSRYEYQRRDLAVQELRVAEKGVDKRSSVMLLLCYRVTRTSFLGLGDSLAEPLCLGDGPPTGLKATALGLGLKLSAFAFNLAESGESGGASPCAALGAVGTVFFPLNAGIG
jgi:hypothetical protein